MGWSMFALSLLFVSLLMRRDLFKNGCTMTYMSPSYETIPVAYSDVPYNLLRYTESPSRTRTTAILFIPGHTGSFNQVRSIAKHVRRLSIDADVYTLDFLEEPSGMHAGLLWQEARFLSAATRTLDQLHPEVRYLPPRTTLHNFMQK